MPPTSPGTAGAPIPDLPTSVTGFVGAAGSGPVDTPVTVTSAADYHATFGPSLDAQRPLGHAVDLFFINGGQSAVVVRSAGVAPDQLVPAEAPAGVHALNESGVTVLVLPGLTAEHLEQVRAVLARCAAYRAVLLLDLPPGPWTSATARALEDVGTHRERVAAYHPWVITGDVSVPPSGAVAGVIARTDRERGVWKAPAGVAVHGVDGLVEQVGDRLSAELTRHGVNPLRELPGRGRQVWGARTLAAAQPVESAQRYLNVRRLTDHVLASLVAGLGFVQDEPSGPTLWSEVRRLTDSFLRTLHRCGALQGVSTQQAYFVRCGPGETMSEADLAAGVLVLTVGLAMLRPAEFDVHVLRLPAGMPSAPSLGPPAAPTDPGDPGDGAEGAPENDTVDLAAVVSRYVDETEKNLRRVFDRAERSGEVLIFDEADELFGKRTQVRDAHDKYAAPEVRSRIEQLARERGVLVRWRRKRPPPP